MNETTRDNTGTPLPEVGSVWVSKDRRDQGRRVTVVSVSTGFAIVKSVRQSRVRLPLTRLYWPLDGAR